VHDNDFLKFVFQPS